MKGTQSHDKCDVITVAATSAARGVGELILGKRISLVLSGGNVPGQSFHLADRGWILPRMRADMVLVQGDPTRNILATRNITAV
jgi:hypothetical protein